jgi:hypothetical protein
VKRATFIVHFMGVGRQKRSWAAAIPCDANGTHPDLNAIEASVRANHALASQDIDVVMGAGGLHGTIFAGIRNVGRWEVQP